MWNIYVPKLFPALGLVCVWKDRRSTFGELRLTTRIWTPPPNYLPNSLALLCSMSPLPFALTVPTLKKKLVTMPNIGQGIIKSHSPLKKLRRRCFFPQRAVVTIEEVSLPEFRLDDRTSPKRKGYLSPTRPIWRLSCDWWPARPQAWGRRWVARQESASHGHVIKRPRN